MGATPPPPSSLTPAWRWRPHRGTVLTSGVEAAPRSTRDRILEAACDLIAADGIDDVRIARVATRAGASTALVHHYFSTREELLEQALIHSFELVGEGRFPDGGDEAESATAALALAIRECLPEPGRPHRDWVLWVELWLRAVREPDLRPVAARLYERYRAWMEALIRAGIRSGEFRSEVDAGAVADLAMALLDGAGIRALIADPAMDVEAARALVAQRLAPQLGIEPDALI
jgi:AcrR family transcriptional regulator